MSYKIPLTLVKEGEEAIIVDIFGGYRLKRKLAELGFNPGTRIRVLRATAGPIIVDIRNSRIAIGRGMAMKVYVQPVK